jgi:hypothetical protein
LRTGAAVDTGGIGGAVTSVEVAEEIPVTVGMTVAAGGESPETGTAAEVGEATGTTEGVPVSVDPAAPTLTVAGVVIVSGLTDEATAASPGPMSAVMGFVSSREIVVG